MKSAWLVIGIENVWDAPPMVIRAFATEAEAQRFVADLDAWLRVHRPSALWYGPIPLCPYLDDLPEMYRRSTVEHFVDEVPFGPVA